MAQQKNEPSNLAWVVEALHPIVGGGLSLTEFAASLKSQSLAALRLAAADKGAEEGGARGEGGEVGVADGAGTAHVRSDETVGKEIVSKTLDGSIGSGECAAREADAEAEAGETWC